MPTVQEGKTAEFKPSHTVATNVGVATPYTGSVQGATATKINDFRAPGRNTVVGSRLVYEVVGDIYNNSGANVAYTWQFRLNATVYQTKAVTLGPSGNRYPFVFRSKVWVGGDLEVVLSTTLRIGDGSGTLSTDVWTVGMIGVGLNTTVPVSFFVGTTIGLWAFSNSVNANAQIRFFAADLEHLAV